MKNKVIVLVGPTAVGKTDLSIDIAKHYDLEIISGDSMQIYKGMDIGTGKITEEEMQGIPHHMLDIITPEENYSVAEFQHDVQVLIDDIYNRGKIPFIVGGTGFYIQALLYNFNFDKNNETDTKMKYDALILGLNQDREKLYENINKRIDKMFEEGLLEEVETLFEQYHFNLTASGGIGYKEFFPYFEGNLSLEEVKENIKKNARRYAKRQFTYFRNKLPVTWVEKDENVKEIIFDKIDEFLNKNI